MSWLEAVLLGTVQGLTEFLPVSSSGHLVIAQTLLGAGSPGVFIEVVLHVATLMSVLFVYRARIAGLAAGALRREPDAWRYLALLALATLPAAVVGLAFEDRIEQAFDAPVVTGLMLLVTGMLLWSTRYAPEERRGVHPAWTVALAIGLAQAFAILPGISRSGSTIAVALWAGLAGEHAAEFSFLMSIPAIAGAAVLQMGAAAGAAGGLDAGAIAAGFAAAAVAGVLAIRGLIWLVRRDEFDRFAYYVWAVGGLFLLFLLGSGS